MLAVNTISEQISEIKASRRAVILAHHYQEREIQEVADLIGDTMELALAAQRLDSEVIAFCGAKFMAETVKVLNPASTVLMPDLKAGCSLVDSCPAAAVRAYRKRNPSHVIVSYINTSVEVKAESDILCTAENAVDIVNSIPPKKPILFLPDINLGNWVKKQTGRTNMQIWQGACIVHATFSGRRLAAARVQHPDALIAAHPECPAELLRMADFTGSATAVVEWCKKQTAREFIIVLDSGVQYSLQKNSPEKRFYFVQNESCNCSECPYLRVSTLEKLLTCLETLRPSIKISDDEIARASLPIERMLQVSPSIEQLL